MKKLLFFHVFWRSSSSWRLAKSFQRLSLLFMVLLLCGFAQAQETTITGTVSDADGLPLPGVTVMEKGTNNGTQTDFDGYYSLNVGSAQSVLVFSYVGMKTFEEVVGDRSSIDVGLQEDVAALDEVVVVGYGTQVRSKVAGAVDQINEQAFEGRSSANVAQSLQGKSPGLVIQQRNSEPGAGLNINIRGISTLGNNNPLIVIDGIVGGDINSLNPADIESISVLKDAGMLIKGMASIFTYGFDAATKNFKDQDCQYISLCDYNTLLPQAIAQQYIEEADLSILKEWRANPSNWKK